MPAFNILVSDKEGNIFDLEGVHAAGRSGGAVFPLEKGLIELPEGSQLFMLPARKAVGYSAKTGEWVTFNDAFAVAAYLAPGYIHSANPLYEREPGAPQLPYFSYTAVGYRKGKYYVPAVRMEKDPKHQAACFDDRILRRQMTVFRKRYPNNRLVEHFAEHCVKQFGCPNAKNYFMNRWEAPISVSAACNAACVGCISEQDKGKTPAPQFRLSFVPSVDEIVEIAVPHLETAENAMISFGQGCEGEPLMRAGLIREAVSEIRKKTDKGVIHMNTNGSMPSKIEDLFKAGLDSIRVSMNSAQPEYYEKYFRPVNYAFSDVVESLLVARRMKKFASVNYLVFPGFTDTRGELQSFIRLIRKTSLPYVQWRNLNIDPDYYKETMELRKYWKYLGLPEVLKILKMEIPGLSHGCANKPKKETMLIMKKAGL